jgi:hypothetical protein
MQVRTNLEDPRVFSNVVPVLTYNKHHPEANLKKLSINTFMDIQKVGQNIITSVSQPTTWVASSCLIVASKDMII